MLLGFYPFTFTGLCEGELCRLRDGYAQFDEAGVQVFAISCDTGPAQAKWAEQQGLELPVLSDFWPHGEVAKAYGIFNDDFGCANRATFLIGADEWSTRSAPTASAPSGRPTATPKLSASSSARHYGQRLQLGWAPLALLAGTG